MKEDKVKIRHIWKAFLLFLVISLIGIISLKIFYFSFNNIFYLLIGFVISLVLLIKALRIDEDSIYIGKILESGENIKNPEDAGSRSFVGIIIFLFLFLGIGSTFVIMSILKEDFIYSLGIKSPFTYVIVGLSAAVITGYLGYRLFRGRSPKRSGLFYFDPFFRQMHIYAFQEVQARENHHYAKYL